MRWSKTMLPPLLATLIATPVVAAEPSAMEWVQRMSDAMRNLNYRGNFVYLHKNFLLRSYGKITEKNCTYSPSCAAAKRTGLFQVPGLDPDGGQIRFALEGRSKAPGSAGGRS